MDTSLTLLIDASSLIYRAFFSNRDTIRARDGTPMNAAYGFLRMLSRLVTDWNPDFVCCATDEDWRPDWRVRLIDTYKTSRAEPGSAQDQTERQLAGQMPVLYQVLTFCGVPVVGHRGYEAEDVIGTLAARAPGRVAIVSGDRDLFQLVHDPAVFVLYPKRGVSLVDRVDESYIETRFGIPGRAYRDYAVLRGDPSDGLPGVRGIGEKLASSLIARYGSLESVMLAAANSRGNVALGKVYSSLDYIERALQVVTIPTDLPLPELDLTRPRGQPIQTVHALAENNGLTDAVLSLTTALMKDRRVVTEGPA
ncbi:5'-3' exonuclease [soil metagenome]